MNPQHARLIVFCVLAAPALCLAGGCEEAGDAMATVNETEITRSEFEARLKREHGAEALRNLVDRTITQSAADAAGLEPDEARVEFKMQQAELRAGGHDLLVEKLAEECKTLEMLREEFEAGALVDQLISRSVTVSEDEIAAYYEEAKEQFAHGEMIKARLMLLETGENAEAVLEVLDEPGADFAGLAGALSIDPGTMDSGGDMGWIERGDYAEEITQQAFSHEVGEHTGVIEYADGFAIVSIEEKKPAGHTPLVEVGGEIRSRIARQKELELQPTWASEQRRKAEIEILDESLKEAFERMRAQ